MTWLRRSWNLWLDISYHISQARDWGPYIFWIIFVLIVLTIYWQCGVPTATPSDTPKEWVPP